MPTLRLPALFADPPPFEQPIFLANGRLFDGTSAPIRDGTGILVEDGRIARVGLASDAVPEGTVRVDVAGKTVMPGIVNCHVHAIGQTPPSKMGADLQLQETHQHFLARQLQESLQPRRGVLRS